MMRFVTLNEIMLRLATPGYLRFSQCNEVVVTFGGGEANVAASLVNYGIPVDYITLLPKNDIDRACEMELKKYGISTNNIVWGGERLGFY